MRFVVSEALEYFCTFLDKNAISDSNRAIVGKGGVSGRVQEAGVGSTKAPSIGDVVTEKGMVSDFGGHKKRWAINSGNS